MTLKCVRNPISGTILVPNAGLWTGVYRNPTVEIPPPPVPPSWLSTDQPGFATPPTGIVGSVINLNLGTPVPDTALVSALIGTGTGAEDFSGPFIVTGGTQPPQWAIGSNIIARFIVAQGDLTKTVFVSSGVLVISAGGDGFPEGYSLTGSMDGSGDWSSVEKRSGDVPGLRTFTLKSSVIVPTGFTIRAYSGSASGGIATNSDTFPMTPGQSFETGGSLPIGSTCYNHVYLRKNSDGAYKKVSSNTVIFTILGLTTPTNPPATFPDLTNDQTVSTLALARTAALNKINSGLSGDWVIGYTTASSGTADLSNIVNPYATSTTNRIIIRPSGGTYSGTTADDASCSMKHIGNVSLNGSRGVWFAAAEITGFVSAESSTLCGITNCIVQGRTPSTTIVPTIGQRFLIDIRNATAFTVSHCVVRMSNDGAIKFERGKSCNIYGNITDYLVSDEYKVWDYLEGSSHERNWSCRFYFPAPGSHPDYFQNQGIRHINNRHWGNVILADARLSVDAWYCQGYQFGTDPTKGGATLSATGSTVEQHITVQGLTFINGYQAAPWGTDKYNTNIALGDQPGPRHTFGSSPRDYNLIATTGSSANASAGPNGVSISTGSPGARNYSGLSAYFDYWELMQNSAGVFTSSNTQVLKTLLPKSGTRAHWLHPNPVGAYLRSREIFDPSYRATAEAAAGYPVYPFSWPVLATHRKRYNSDAFVNDAYTGTWNSSTLLPG